MPYISSLEKAAIKFNSSANLLCLCLYSWGCCYLEECQLLVEYWVVFNNKLISRSVACRGHPDRVQYPFPKLLLRTRLYAPSRSICGHSRLWTRHALPSGINWFPQLCRLSRKARYGNHLAVPLQLVWSSSVCPNTDVHTCLYNLLTPFNVSRSTL